MKIIRYLLVALSLIGLMATSAYADEPSSSLYGVEYTCSGGQNTYQFNNISTRLNINDGCISPTIKSSGDVYLYWNKSDTSPNSFYPLLEDNSNPTYHIYNFEGVFLNPALDNTVYDFRFKGTDEIGAFDLNNVSEEVYLYDLDSQYKSNFDKVSNVDIHVNSNVSADIETTGKATGGAPSGDNSTYIMHSNGFTPYIKEIEGNDNLLQLSAIFSKEYGDYNGNGVIGVPYFNDSPFTGSQDNLYVYEPATNNSYFVGSNASSTSIGDVTGDGSDEIVTVNPLNDNLVYFDNGERNIINISFTPGTLGGVGNVDDDGYGEILIENEDLSNNNIRLVDIGGQNTDVGDISYFIPVDSLGALMDIDGDGYYDETTYTTGSFAGVLDISENSTTQTSNFVNGRDVTDANGFTDTDKDGTYEMCVTLGSEATIECIEYNHNTNSLGDSNYISTNSDTNRVGAMAQLKKVTVQESINYIIGDLAEVKGGELDILNGNASSTDLNLYTANSLQSNLQIEGKYYYGNSIISANVLENTINSTSVIVEDPITSPYYANTLIYDNTSVSLSNNITSYGTVGGNNISNEHLYKNGSNRFTCPSSTNAVTIDSNDYSVCPNKTAVFSEGNNTLDEFVITTSERVAVNAPSQLASLSPINHGFNEKDIYDVDNYFSSYDNVSLYFTDKENNRSVILTGSKGDARDDTYDNGEWSITVTSLSDVINIKFDSDFNSLKEMDFTLEACNSAGCNDLSSSYTIDRDNLPISVYEHFYRGHNSYLEVDIGKLLQNGSYYKYNASIVRDNGSIFKLDSRESVSTLPTFKNTEYFDVKAFNDSLAFWTKDENIQIIIDARVYNTTDDNIGSAYLAFTIEDGLPTNPYPTGSSPSGYEPKETDDEVVDDEDGFTFPTPSEENQPLFALAIIIAVVGMVAYASVYGESQFLSSSVFGVVALSGTFFLLSYLGWIPTWILVMVLTAMAMWVSRLIFSYVTNK